MKLPPCRPASCSGTSFQKYFIEGEQAQNRNPQDGGCPWPFALCFPHNLFSRLFHGQPSCALGATDMFSVSPVWGQGNCIQSLFLHPPALPLAMGPGSRSSGLSVPTSLTCPQGFQDHQQEQHLRSGASTVLDPSPSTVHTQPSCGGGR